MAPPEPPSEPSVSASAVTERRSGRPPPNRPPPTPPQSPPPVPQRPAIINASSPWFELTRGNQSSYYYNERTSETQDDIPEEGVHTKIPEVVFLERQRETELEEEGEEGDDARSEISQEGPITQRTPKAEEEGEHEEKSLWEKLTIFVQGTEYEQFIQEIGQELKELFTDYLTEYFEDLEDKEDIDVLKVKYTSFVDEYYQKAIEKDKELIQKLKGV